MMRQYQLVERVKRYNPAADEALLNRAYIYAMRAHGTQKRASGDLYFGHPLEVAAILTDLKLDDATIAAAVLHDTVEDTAATLDEIKTSFGQQIGELVDGLTKIKRLDLVSKRAAQGENFRKLLLAIAADVRVLLVKLADRLHNMRTLHFVSPEKRKRIAEETLEIYAPLAGRMGIQEMRDELEDLAFRHLHPEAYETISRRLRDLSEKSEELVDEIEKRPDAKARRQGADGDGHGPAEAALFDLAQDGAQVGRLRAAVRHHRASASSSTRSTIATGRSASCTPPGRWCRGATRTTSRRRSRTTTVPSTRRSIGPGRQRVELQIRTPDMDEVAEYGIAAHALYKDGGTDPSKLASESRAYEWLRRTIDLLAEGDNPEEFLEHTKLELFHDQVFCFTPKGRLIALPRGATPIDFAYAVHTDVGNSAVGCKINGRMAPLLTELGNGDEVEIVRADGQIPPAAWESLVVTGKARAAIRRATRVAVRRQYAGLGHQILERAFERAGKTFSDEKLKASLARLARASADDVLAAVGRGEMFSGDVVRAVYPDYKDDRRPGGAEVNGSGRPAPGDPAVKIKLPKRGSGQGAIPIRGIDSDLPVRFAPNGGAVPGIASSASSPPARG